MNKPEQFGEIHGLPMANYLGIPGVSASLIQTMLERCPRAAWYESWLGPGVVDHTDLTDRGTIAHAILLEGTVDAVAVIDPADHPNKKGGGCATGWTNESIRNARDEARAAGKIPLLKADIGEINAMVDAAHEFIESLRETESAIWRAFQPDGGDSELTMTWREGDTLCKIRPDRIATDRGIVINYKTTSTSVEPDRWGRKQMFGEGHYVGAAWYRRGVKALLGVEPDYVYLAQECEPPYLCSLVGVDPAAFALAAAKCETALRDWQRCVNKNVWPAYPSRVVYPELPAYEQTRWEERETISLEERFALGSQA